MIAHATPPDYRGMVNLSLHHGGTYAELRLAGQDPARLLMIETSPYLPRTRALDNYPNEIHVDEIDVLIEGEARPPELPPETRTEVDHAIAELAASFVTDDATLQTGIGGVPSIVAENLAARAGATFGVHTEMFTDGLWKLHLAGKVRNQAKGLYEGISVATFALGGRGLYDWLDGNEEVAFGPVSVVNDPAIIGANNHLVAINGGLQVDLFGQVVADYVGGRQISGVGGHEDFVAGTDLTPGTVTLICLPSTAQVGAETVSRVVSELPAGSIVSTPRHHAPVVITEFGAADLRDCTVHERATRLAEVAHPDFRADLRAAAELLR
jgi:acyl-CoA hydrolase